MHGAGSLVAVKLSRQSGEQFEEQSTNELVEWFNRMDANSHQEPCQLNELNCARFDAKLKQRLAEHDARAEQRFVDFEAKADSRFPCFEAKVDKRFADSESEGGRRFQIVESRIDELRTCIDPDSTLLESRFGKTLEHALHTRAKCMLGLWVGMAAGLLLLS